jgi:flagellin-like hook-associated protein FlgL
MKGDPYEIHSFGSTGSTGAMEASTNVIGTPNDAQEDTMQINLGSASLFADDQVSLIINGELISYTANTADQTKDADPATNATWAESYLAIQIADKINGNNNINSEVRAVPNQKMTGGTLQSSPGSVLIHSKVRGTLFTSSGQTLTLSSVNKDSASISLSTTSPNIAGAKKEVSVKISPDVITTPNGGKIAIGDRYTLRITEGHQDEVHSRYGFFDQEHQTYTVTVNTANMTNDQIRDQFVNDITARPDSPDGSYEARTGASGELIISEKNAGDTFTINLSVQTRDSLSRSQDVPNVSPFSIESSMNFLCAMLAQNGAEQSRLNMAHENLENHYAFGERALSRISDTDTAREASQLAKISLKMNLAEQVMSKSARLKDILIPLTTNHFRSSVLSSSL